MQPILPEQGSRPYQYRFSPRNIGSDIVRGLLPAPINIADRLLGNNLRGGVDRMFGGTRDRYLSDESAYMRDMMRNDPGNQSTSLSQRLRNLFGGGDRQGQEGAETFGIGEDQGPANPAWVDEWIRNGSGPLPSRAPPMPQGNRVGAGRGTTLASGPAAQAMFEGMRAGANASQTRSQARNAMTNMFSGEER